MLAALHTLNRLELVSETLTHTLNQLATIVPDWLKAQVPVQWFDRYSRRLFEYRLPKDKKKRIILAETIGTDGHYLLAAIYAKTAPDFLRSLKAVETMRQIWIQHFFIEADTVHWREKDNLPPAALMICSPHDTDARYSTKRETSWIGYKVHLTETCDKEGPNLITHVQTTLATVPDIQVTGQIHHDLSQRELLPEKHIVDTAYIDGDLLTNSSRQYGQFSGAHRVSKQSLNEVKWYAQWGRRLGTGQKPNLNPASQRLLCNSTKTTAFYAPVGPGAPGAKLGLFELIAVVFFWHCWTPKYSSVLF